MLHFTTRQKIYRDLFDQQFNFHNQFETDMYSELYHLTIVPSKRYTKVDTIHDAIHNCFHDIKALLSCVVVGEVSPGGMEHYHALAKVKEGHKFMKMNTILHKAGFHVRTRLIHNEYYKFQCLMYIFKDIDKKINVNFKLSTPHANYIIGNYEYFYYWNLFILPLELKYHPLRLK